MRTTLFGRVPSRVVPVCPILRQRTRMRQMLVSVAGKMLIKLVSGLRPQHRVSTVGIMYHRGWKLKPCRGRFGVAGMTLVEVLVATAVSGLAMGSLVGGYIFCSASAEKSAISMAANARAMERLEQTRCALWNTSTYPVTDQLAATNFPTEVVTLDLSGAGTGVTYGTNYTVISQVSTSPQVRRIRVDCVWQFRNGQIFTNSIETCRAPDQ